MGFTRGVVQLYSFPGGRQSAGIGFFGRHRAVLAEQVIAIGQAYVSLFVIWVVDDGLGEVIDGFVQGFGGALVPLISTLQIEIPGFRIWSVSCGDCFSLGDMRTDGSQ